MSRTLIITNDYPPRPGGIQAFVQAMAYALLPSDVVVYASTWRGHDRECRRHDAAQKYLTVRARTSVLLPDPVNTRRAREIARAEDCDRVWFGAAAPLGLMAPALRQAGVGRLVATTHGHEASWARLPGARWLLHRIGDSVDVVTYLGEYFRPRVGSALSQAARARMVQLSPGVDTEAFHPALRAGPAAAELRSQLGLRDRPTIVCVSRLVPRKGQDTLIRALPVIQQAEPDAALLVVGGGPYRQELERLVRSLRLGNDVVFSGPVAWADLPLYHAAGDVFAMPCRTRRQGLDVEGFGIVYLEAGAVGLPVVAGNSGGAPDAVLDGETGYVVPGASVERVAAAVSRLLTTPTLAAKLGEANRAWVASEWDWSVVQARFRTLFTG